MNDKRAIWSMAFGQTIFWAGIYYIFPALIVRWETEFGWSKSEMTAALTMALVTTALVSPLVGRMIDKGHGPLLMAGGGLLGGVFIGVLGFVSTLPVFYGIWVVLGASMACCLYEPCFSFLLRHKGLEAKRPITIITLVAGLAGTVTFPVSHLISDFAGWRFALLVFVILICFVGVPLIWIGARAIERNNNVDQEEKSETVSKNSHRYGFLLEAKFWFLAFGFMLLYMNHNAIINHFLLLLKDRQFDPDLAIIAVTFMGPMQVLGRFTMMVLERHVSSIIGVMVSFLFVALATVAMMGAAEIPELLFVFIILQGSGIGIMTIMKPMVSRHILGAENYGLKSGIQSVPYMIGSAFAALIGSLVWAVGGYDLVLKVLLAAPLIGLLFFLIAVGLSKR
ncbi:MAG: MFS transporter [Sneathiella sp.]|nr:MFS transporter [Sneathiella sp.]